MSEPLEVVLWGESQVGKTTALAAYFCERSPTWLDTAATETRATLAALSPFWNSLLENRLSAGTVNATTYDVRHRDQRLIRFRDMRGANAGSIAAADVAALQAATGVLVFTSWPGDRDVRNLVAARNALRLRGARGPTGLVVTKVEGFLRREQMGLFVLENPLSVARRLKLADSLIALMTEIPAVFLISVYGYTDDGFPAHYRDEFGRLVPCRIRPTNVASPFDHIIASLP